MNGFDDKQNDDKQKDTGGEEDNLIFYKYERIVLEEWP